MRTRTIAVLVVAGLALVVLSQPPAPRPDGPGRAGGDKHAPPATAGPPEPVEPAVEKLVAEPATTTTVAVPTSMPPETEHRGAGDPVGERWPLTKALPKDALGWRIDYRVEGERLVLTATLRAVLNRADQLEAYRADLRVRKAQAMEWLVSKAAGAAYAIEWRPPEAGGL